MKKMEHRIKKGLLFIPIFIGGVFLFTWLVMLLWNNILPEVTGVKAIGFFQAMGILALSKILFGFHSGWGGRHRRKQAMEQKLQHMTPEEREKFKSEWKHRCGSRWNIHSAPDPQAGTAEPENTERI
jgi:hypothetical protein